MWSEIEEFKIKWNRMGINKNFYDCKFSFKSFRKTIGKLNENYFKCLNYSKLLVCEPSPLIIDYL